MYFIFFISVEKFIRPESSGSSRCIMRVAKTRRIIEDNNKEIVWLQNQEGRINI